LAFTAARAIGAGGKIVGLDFSAQMLHLAMRKKAQEPDGGKTSYVLASALLPPFRDNTFDAVITAFVLRNVGDLTTFFLQAQRLLKPGGRLVSLDMFPPSRFPFSIFYSLYFHRVMPWIGARLAHDREAYRYLSKSVKEFHSPATVADIVARAGFANVTTKTFLQGAVCLHSADKPGRL
jgi:demethylmenaquinone methyltransferase / 2-methoxy-6-polyprenyl-1,4-benzoquinol methylase